MQTEGIAIRRLALDRDVLSQLRRRLTISLRQRRSLIPEQRSKDFRMEALIQAKLRNPNASPMRSLLGIGCQYGDSHRPIPGDVTAS